MSLMLWRSTINRWPTHVARCRRFATDVRQHDEPLRILFCGSDDFSIAALRSLYKYAENRTSDILSIDVVAKKDKPSGRGLRALKEPLIKSVAEELRLHIHQINTFTGWHPPTFPSSTVPTINLIIAVSFGLMVPARLINAAEYGGLNIHPSLLPDLRGAAPLNWAILKGYSHSGVSIQTLHPTKFDEGTILAQTAPLPISENTDVDQLRHQLAPIGAELLVKAIQDKLYLQPQDAVEPQIKSVSLASKITPELKTLDPSKDDLDAILRKNRAIPKLFAYASWRKGDNDVRRIRVLFPTDLRATQPGEIPSEVYTQVETGVPFAITTDAEEPSAQPQPIYVICHDGNCLAIPRMLVAGKKEAPASQAATSSKLFARKSCAGRYTIHHFLEPLRTEDR